ncbi:outer membrane lipoprotein carrier protein LolA [Flavobacterium sp. xlx-214]|uniref:LolA family protein n=1 Tax=unclassified Flavobacterium TaxID=196869 RepID=UPI0013D02C99|nr:MULTISPECIES: outer membrane lipoprotein carrier protein LolA [unclassified Flavobacterium]MBA5791441.1 outer membrane lipoprotein carrier protein LolA [Flavobacterium sp. xlx-221]QMI83408.1 outer membrane lipoprotein carrier protein LolA [Flavobacterium sp. xlx-214]
MKKIIALVTLLFVAVNVQAQTADKSKKLLDEVSAKIKTYKNISIDFTYQNGSKESKGKATLQGEKYVVDFMGVTQLFDGSKMYIINPADEEVTVASASSANSQAVSIANLLTFYKSGYKYVWGKSQTIGGKNIQIIKLVPNKNQGVKEILLGIDTKSKQIYNRTDVFSNGSKSVITVKSFTTNQTLSKNHFTFTKSKYPNYYINNLD